MELLSFVPLACMILSDCRERVVRLYPLLFFGVLSVTGSCWVYGGWECLSRVIYGVCVLAFLMGGGILYLFVKYGRGVNPFRDYLGVGDVLFLLCLTPSFGVREFTLFLIVAFVLSLVGWLTGACGKKGDGRGVPLVATVGVCYAFYVVSRLIYHWLVL